MGLLVQQSVRTAIKLGLLREPSGPSLRGLRQVAHWIVSSVGRVRVKTRFQLDLGFLHPDSSNILNSDSSPRYPAILQCDNRTEFKGALVELCNKVKVRVINGALYKPLTQGSVESANSTFKRRLKAGQKEKGTRDWGRFLPCIAIAMNIVSLGIEAGTLPNEVHFSREPHWRRVAVAN